MPIIATFLGIRSAVFLKKTRGRFFCLDVQGKRMHALSAEQEIEQREIKNRPLISAEGALAENALCHTAKGVFLVPAIGFEPMTLRV